MAEEPLHLIFAGSLPDQKRRAGVTEIMESEGGREARRGYCRLEVPSNPAVAQSGALAGRENQGLNADIVDKYEIEFAEMASGSFGRQRLGKVPRGYNLGGVPVKVLFAPDHAPELEISKHINKCRDRLDFAIFTFSGSSGIDDAMMMLKRAGIAVRGAIDPGQGRFGWAPTRRLHEAGVEVFLPRKEAPFRKLHHKLMVIDDAAVIAGSFNYTGNANDYNDENIFVIGSPHPDLPNSEGGPVDVDECAGICAFFRAEIDRIIDDLSDPYQP